jgi:hypothetical protein
MEMAEKAFVFDHLQVGANVEMAGKRRGQFGEKGRTSYVRRKAAIDEALVDGEDVDRLVARVHRSEEIEKNAVSGDEEILGRERLEGLVKNEIGVEEQRAQDGPLRLCAIEDGRKRRIGP